MTTRACVKQYREVKRKAQVGERIRIVNACDRRYKNGDEFQVSGGDEAGVWVKHQEGNIDGCAGVFHSEYVVLEEVPSAPASQEDVIAALTVNLSRLQREFDEYKAETDAQFTEIAAQLADRGNCGWGDASYVKAAAGSVTDRIPSFITRDDVVRRAIADVKTLLNRNYPFSPTHLSVWFSDADGSFITDKCEFVVSREKRTVVALISTLGGHVIHRGIAKCAPGDAFNVHIGKAIALRRALGLEVPREYVKCPQPAEGDVRVGDIVHFSAAFPRVTVVPSGAKYVTGETIPMGTVRTWIHLGSVYVIDDSARYDSEVSAE